ncbi:MAG: MarR family transcriptional regulator, partial [Pseudomonadota bacterium]
TKFNDTLPMILFSALDNIMPRYRAVFQKFKVTEAQWRILRVLSETEHMTHAALAKACLLPTPSLVGTIDRMAKRGLVNRARSETDRRSVQIQATEKGKALVAQMLPHMIALHSHAEASVSKSDWTIMERTLSDLGQAFQLSNSPLTKETL